MSYLLCLSASAVNVKHVHNQQLILDSGHILLRVWNTETKC